MRLKLISSLTGLCLLLLVSAAPGTASGERALGSGVPSTFDPSTSGHEWVAADKAFQEGEVNWEVFSDDARERVEGLVSSALDPGAEGPWNLRLEGCLTVSRIFVPPRNDSRVYGPMKDLVRTSKSVLLGEVVGQREGFHNGVPKTLYLLRISEQIKGHRDEKLDEVLFFYPYARIPYRSGFLCGAGPRFPDHPEEGDRVLLFASHSDRVDGHEVVFPEDPEIFFAGPGKALSTPRHVAKPNGAGEPLFDELVEEARRAIGDDSPPGHLLDQEGRP